MTTVLDENVHCLSVSGTFDNCQDILKSLLADKQFNEKYHLGAVNSINWARILVQIIYYFSAYFQLLKNPNVDLDRSEVQFVVPTGNFGDVLAGYYAKRMGLPMGKLGVATNSNDILARFWKSGSYQKVDPNAGPVAGGVYATISPAMDIAVSSNFERLLWYLAYGKAVQNDDAAKRAAACDQVREWMTAVKTSGTVDLSAVLEGARRDFVADKANDEQVRLNSDSNVQLVKSLIRRSPPSANTTRRNHTSPIRIQPWGYMLPRSLQNPTPRRPSRSSFPQPTLPSLPRLFREPTLRLILKRCSVTSCRESVAYRL
jgi:threonine synthase